MTARWGVVLAGLLLVAAGASSQNRPAEFHDWLRKGDVAALSAAIDKDTSLVNLVDAQGVPPLFWAAFYGQKAVVQLLLSRGADARSTCPLGTPVHAAVVGGQPELLSVLAAGRADLDGRDPSGRIPLLLAAQQGRLPIVEALLDAGASIAATDAMGSTALIIAASYGQEPIVRLLVSKKANPAAANSRGDSALDVARREGHTGVAAYLEAQGAVPRRPAVLPAGPFLGETPPGLTPKLFAPSVVSTERRELNAAFLPDGRAAFFSRNRGRGTVIMMASADGRRWTMPEPAPFSRGGYSDVDMFVTADGREIYFCSDRPLPGAPAAPPAAVPAAGGRASGPPPPPPSSRVNIWVTMRTADAWSDPAWIGPVVSSGTEDYYPTLTRAGTLYFSSNRPGGLGENDIYRARRVDGKWSPPENVGRPVSSEYREFDPFIASDERYLIFASNRPGGLGNADLYISFRTATGAWDEPRNMGPAVNSSASDYTPMLSPDGKYLFFTSNREGQDDIFWIDAGVIAGLRAATQAPASAAAPGGSLVAEIPITVERNKTIVPVMAGGAALRLILDSGHALDGVLIFSTDKVDRSAFGPSFAATVAGAGSGSGSNGLVFEAGSFTVGPVEFNNQRVIVLTSDPFKGSPTDGIIGHSLFGRYVVELDYDRNVMRLHDSDTFTVKPGWESLPFYFKDNRIPWIDIEVATDGEPPVRLATYIDSASSEALELLTRDANRFHLPANTKERYLGRGLSGDIYGREGTIAKLRVGSHELANVLVAIAPAAVRSGQAGEADAIIGNNLLRHFNVIFDYAHRKLYIRPNSHF